MLHSKQIGHNGNHLLMLHGWGQSHQNLQQLGELLAPNHHIHLIDLPGFGLSPHPGDTWNTFQYAERLAQYLHEHNIDRCHILGHSFGGKVAMSFAIMYPHLTNRLILIAPSGLKRHRSLPDKLRMKAIQFFGKTLKSIDVLFKTALFQDHFAPKYGSVDYRNAGAMRAILVKSVNEDLSDKIATIKAPTLLLWGENDTETPPEIAIRLQMLIEGSKLILFPQKGHNLFHDCGSHLCASYIAPFLAQNSMGNDR